MDENTKIKDMEITDEFIMIRPEVKGQVVVQNLQDLDDDGVVLITKDGEKVSGFITRKEIFDTLANGINPLDTPASDMMNTDFMEVNGDVTIGNLLRNISDKYPKVIVVVDSYNLCIGYFSKNDYKDAMLGLGYYDKSTEPKTPEEWLARGIAMTSLGKVEDASKCYENSLALHIDKERAWFELGKRFEMDKRFKDAILCFDRVVSINPENEEAWINRGNVYSILRMPDRAVQSYSHAVTLNPKNDESIINMGLAHCDVGNIDEAISCYNTAEERTGETAKLWYCKGNAYNKGRDHNKAVDCYSQAIKINPEYEDAWFNKGSALHLLGENKKAIECLNQVLHVNPYNESAREAIKICKDALTKNQ